MPAVSSTATAETDQGASHLLERPVLPLSGARSKFVASSTVGTENVNRIKVSHTGELSQSAGIRSFKITTVHKDGRQHIRSHDIEFRPNQDVLDLLPYAIIDGEAFFALTITPRPALSTRPGNQKTREAETGFILNMPGAYIDPAKRDCLRSTAAFILGEKLGVLPAEGASLEFLCGSAFPSARDSTEQCHRRMVEVMLPSEDKLISHGRGLACERITVLLNYGQLRDEIQKGNIRDLRLVEALQNFIKIHPNLIAPDSITPPHIQLRDNLMSENLKQRIVNKEEVRNLLLNPSSLPEGISEIQIEKGQSAGYLRAAEFRAEVITNAGETSESFNFATVRRACEQGDSFSCAAMLRIEGADYLLVREAERPAIKVRELVAHPISGEFPHTHFEGVGGVCSMLLSDEERLTYVNQHIKTSFGIELSPARPVEKLFSGYPSCGFSPSLAHLYASEVDAAAAGKWDRSVKLIRVSDYSELANEGAMRDLSLNAAVSLVSPRLIGSRHSDAIILHPDLLPRRNRYLSLLDQGSEIHAWISQDEARRSCYSRLSHDARIRLLLGLAENELGLVMGIMNNPREASFFSPTLPLYPLMMHERGSAVAVLHFIHDLAHFLIGDYIPAPPGGNAAAHKAEFFELYHENEIVAGWFSDYTLPSVLGADETLELLGRHSLYDLFEAYGIKAEAEAKELYRMMERDGIVPARLLEKPELYDLFRHTIIQSTLYAQVMFHSHADAVYQNWIDYPKTAKTAADFSNRSFQDAGKQRLIFEGSEQQIRQQSEGINPLKASISRVITRDLQIQVMRLAYFAEVVEQKKSQPEEVTKEAFSKIEEMHCIFKRLDCFRAHITNIEASPYNLGVFTELENLLAVEGPLAQFKTYVDRFQAEFLPPEVQAEVEGRLVPFYKKLPFVPKAQIRERIAQLEVESFRKAGLAAPLEPMTFK